MAGSNDDSCGTTAWVSQVWNSANPHLNACTRDVILRLVPSVFLVLFSPAEFLAPSKRGKVSWGFLNILRILLALLISLIHLSDYGSISTETSNKLFLLTPIILTISFLWTAVLLVTAKLKGFVKSGAVWVFVTLSTLSAILNYYFIHDDDSVGKSEIISSHVYLYAVIFLWILCSIADASSPVLEKGGSTDEVSPREVASFPSYFTFSWASALACRGWNKVIDHEDLHPLTGTNKSEYLGLLLRKRLVKRTEYSEHEYQGIVGTIVWTFQRQLLFSGLLRLLSDLSLLLQPLLIKWILYSAMDKDDISWHGYFLAVLLFAVSLLHNILHTMSWDRVQRLGVKVRTALQTSLYRKALSMSNIAPKGQTTREIMYLSCETERIRQLVERMHMSWSLVLQSLVAIYLLHVEIGVSALAAIIPLIIVILLDFRITDRVRAVQEQESNERNERLKYTIEVLSEIKGIKLYAWEERLMHLINEIRKRQIKLIKKMRYWTSLNLSAWLATPILLSLFTFYPYIIWNDEHFMHPARLFFCLAIFNILRQAVKGWPDLVSLIRDSSQAVKRLDSFFSTPDLRNYISRDRDDKNHTITMENASFAWNTTHASSDPSFRLKASLRIPEGSLTAIIGGPTSGKSSLMSAILGEMELLDGRINISPDIQKLAYVPQNAWIMSGTVKENIVFGKLYESVKYLKIVSSCDLESDLALLPEGDMTEVGDNGVPLTESQRQRIAIARACYSDADLFLFDDPLSSLEPDVSKLLYHKIFSSKTGILKKKTRVLVTDHMSVLPDAERIFVLKDGRICAWGTFSELSSTNGTFADLMRHSGSSLIPDVVPDEEQTEAPNSTNTRKDWVRIGKRVTRKQYVRPQVSVRSSMAAYMSESMKKEDKTDDTTDSGSRKKKQSKICLLTYFFRLMSAIPVLIVAGYLLFQILYTSALICISNWSNDELRLHNVSSEADPIEENIGFITYAILSIQSLIAAVIGITALAKGATDASSKLHNKMLQKVLQSPLTFFESTPIAQIVSRFATELAPIDACFFEELNNFFIVLMEIIASVIIITIIFPSFGIVFIIFLIVFIVMQRCYVGTAPQIQRLDEASSSLIMSQFSEALAGAGIIRAFKMSYRFMADSDRRIDRNQVCTTSLCDLNQWRGFRMQLLGDLSLFTIALIGAIDHESNNAAFLGLELLLASTMARQFNLLMRATCFLEDESEALERVTEFDSNEQEAEWHCAIPPPEFWPPQGGIRFYDVSSRYRNGLDMAIRNINFLILPQEKIGVVGRDGAGKSTMALSLLRIIEPASGTVVIDGIDLSTIGVMDVRSRITLMTPDPVMLTGTIRRNVDPFIECEDDEVWWALEIAHLKDFVSGLDQQLSHNVSQIYLSRRQRQLLSLARAVLFKKKILIIDEATTLVDQDTESFIMTVIREQFADCTVINITHRITTILDSDRVLVMDDGKVAEFDSPSRLLQDRDSLFYSMAEEAGVI